MPHGGPCVSLASQVPQAGAPLMRRGGAPRAAGLASGSPVAHRQCAQSTLGKAAELAATCPRFPTARTSGYRFDLQLRSSKSERTNNSLRVKKT